jgi:hypothetical protein
MHVVLRLKERQRVTTNPTDNAKTAHRRGVAAGAAKTSEVRDVD